MKTGLKVKQIMDERGIKYSRLAKTLNCSPSYTSRLLNGERVFTPELLAKTAVFLNVPVETLEGEINHE